MKILILKGLVASTALAVSALVASNASAATYNLDFLGAVVKVNGAGPSTQNYDATVKRATLGCSLNCFGLDSSDVSKTDVSNTYNGPLTSTATGFVSGYSDLFDLKNKGESLERGFVNAATNLSFPEKAGFKTVGGGVSSLSFTSNAEYILFVLGGAPDVTIVKNTGYGNMFTFAAEGGLGSGLSHYVEFGQYECSDCDGDTGGPSPVPLPAGLPLLAAALGLTMFLRKRRT